MMSPNWTPQHSTAAGVLAVATLAERQTLIEIDHPPAHAR